MNRIPVNEPGLEDPGFYDSDENVYCPECEGYFLLSETTKGECPKCGTRIEFLEF